jgi:hypothetical protein
MIHMCCIFGETNIWKVLPNVSYSYIGNKIWELFSSPLEKLIERMQQLAQCTYPHICNVMSDSRKLSYFDNS